MTREKKAVIITIAIIIIIAILGFTFKAVDDIIAMLVIILMVGLAIYILYQLVLSCVK